MDGVACRINAEDKPGLALAAESELGITAGLQDRIIQVQFSCVLHAEWLPCN